MKLTLNGLKDSGFWSGNGFILPKFDIEGMRAETRARPRWVHFGAGNIFRAFPAMRQQRLLDAGVETAGIIAAEGFDFQIIDAAYRPYDELSLSIVLNADGSREKHVVASVAESLKADPAFPDYERLREIFRSPSLQMVSFTISEKGYGGNMMKTVASLLYDRFLAGAEPLALVSMDNCHHNGDVLREAILSRAAEWTENGRAEQGFLEYLRLRDSVAFPLSMIDKITPRPEEGVRNMLASLGLEGMSLTVTDKRNHVAPFVNAEDAAYLVIEDAFPNGRPALEKAGVIFADRETVDKAERMKVSACLNPLHSAMAGFGVMLGFGSVSAMMADPDILALVKGIGYGEAFRTVVNPGVIDPKAFLDEVVEKRFPNPHVPDTPARLCVDLSQGIPVRFGETIRAYAADPALGVDKLVLIPLALAGWCRYLMGVDDNGGAYELSPDPILGELAPRFSRVTLGSGGPHSDILSPVFSDAGLFGVDLYHIGLGKRMEGYFAELASGKGMVRQTLHKYVQPK